MTDWILFLKGKIYQCENCNNQVSYKEGRYYKYCPFCGKKMESKRFGEKK